MIAAVACDDALEVRLGLAAEVRGLPLAGHPKVEEESRLRLHLLIIRN